MITAIGDVSSPRIRRRSSTKVIIEIYLIILEPRSNLRNVPLRTFLSKEENHYPKHCTYLTFLRNVRLLL